MNEQERGEAIRRKLAAMPLETVRYPDPFLATGISTLDSAMGGGFARGLVSELYGPPSCGKTTIALQTVAVAQARGLTAAWMDADRTFSPARAASLGVDLDRLLFSQPDTAEMAMGIARTLALSGVLDLLVIDSAAALAPELELAIGLGEGGPGLQARVLGSGLRRLTVALRRSGAAAIILNQTRGKPDAPHSEEFSACGAPLKFYAATRIALHADEEIIHFRLLKNRPAAPFAAGDLTWDRAGTGLKPL